MDRTQELVEILGKVRNLPTLPPVIHKLRRAIRNPRSDAQKIASMIEDDPAMMARILKVVNSVLYMGREPISSLQLAVARLGFNAISNIALSTSVFSSFLKKDQTDFNREDFWRHSISTGIAVVALQQKCQANLTKRHGSDLLHLAGLLHDVGKILLDMYLHKEFVEAIRLSEQRSISLIDAEHEVFGSDHAQLGAWMGMKWNLTPEFLHTVRWHHDPSSADLEHHELVALCHVANYICNIERIGGGGDVTTPAYNQKAWARLNLTVNNISEIADAVLAESAKSEVLMALVQ